MIIRLGFLSGGLLPVVVDANRIRLQPANSSMKPIYARDVQVLGVVTGVIRKVS